MICGKHVSLRAIEKEDLSQLMEWRNKPELRKFFRETNDGWYICNKAWKYGKDDKNKGIIGNNNEKI